MFIDEGMKDDSNRITISTEDNIYIDDNPAVDIQNENNDISSEIKNWALTENVTAKVVKSLLLIMRKYFKHLPTDPRTLLSTPKSTSLRVVEPEVYYHFCLKNCIIHFLKSNSSYNILSSIDIMFNTDGLPLSNRLVVNCGRSLALLLGLRKFLLLDFIIVFLVSQRMLISIFMTFYKKLNFLSKKV